MWIFPPFLGRKASMQSSSHRTYAYIIFDWTLTGDKLSNDSELEARYYENSEACDLSELMVVANVISGCHPF